MAGVLACRPSVASHFSAAWLWGLLRNRPGTVHLTAPTQRHPRPAFVVHCSRLKEIDTTGIEGIPVTALPRTLLDLAAMLSEARLVRVLERAEELRLFDLGPVEELLGRAAHHSGAAKLGRGLEIYRPDPTFTRSGLEKRFLALARRAGLPSPAMNYVVAGFELDAYWKRERFVVELDAYETHGSQVAFERDRLRQEDLKLIGIEMTRITGTRLNRDPQGTIERVRMLLAQRRVELRLN